MEVLDAYQVDGWLDFVMSLFTAVPAGFVLGCFLGLLSFGVFGLLRMARRLIHR